MKIFLIIFQSDEEDVRNQLIGRIKGFGSWARISNTAWCINSSLKFEIMAKQLYVASQRVL